MRIIQNPSKQNEELLIVEAGGTQLLLCFKGLRMLGFQEA
jgi:hypothetical protein